MPVTDTAQYFTVTLYRTDTQARYGGRELRFTILATDLPATEETGPNAVFYQIAAATEAFLEAWGARVEIDDLLYIKPSDTPVWQEPWKMTRVYDTSGRWLLNLVR